MAALSKKWLISGAVITALLVWGASMHVENKSGSKSSVLTTGEIIVYNGSYTPEDEALLSGLDTLPAPSLIVDDDLPVKMM